MRSAPSTVVRAARLYIAGAVLDLLNLAIGLVMLPLGLAAVVEQRVGDGGAAFAIAGGVLGVLAAAGFAVLAIMLARLLLTARNWARIVLLILALVAVPSAVVPGDSTGLPVAAVVVSGVLAIVSLLVQLTAAVLSFLPESNAWFRAAKAMPAVD